jgi:hypothetical protein
MGAMLGPIVRRFVRVFWRKRSRMETDPKRHLCEGLALVIELSIWYSHPVQRAAES